jgi:SNF2 family DNA or RNA helicase
MNVSIFHGPQREREAKEYLTSDIVLTTYSTLAADQKLSGTLYNLNWFRIILDEGELDQQAVFSHVI